MYHEATLTTEAYYDTFSEVPYKVKVFLPEAEEPIEMTPEELIEMSEREGYYTIMHSVNWGCCDHWTSEKLSKWVKERFYLIRYTDKNGQTVGYSRPEFSVRLTKDSKYWRSEVWNS